MKVCCSWSLRNKQNEKERVVEYARDKNLRATKMIRLCVLLVFSSFSSQLCCSYFLRRYFFLMSFNSSRYFLIKRIVYFSQFSVKYFFFSVSIFFFFVLQKKYTKNFFLQFVCWRRVWNAILNIDFLFFYSAKEKKHPNEVKLKNFCRESKALNFHENVMENVDVFRYEL